MQKGGDRGILPQDEKLWDEIQRSDRSNRPLFFLFLFSSSFSSSLLRLLPFLLSARTSPFLIIPNIYINYIIAQIMILHPKHSSFTHPKPSNTLNYHFNPLKTYFSSTIKFPISFTSHSCPYCSQILIFHKLQ